MCVCMMSIITHSKYEHGYVVVYTYGGISIAVVMR